MKKIIALTLALIMIASLAACGGNSTDKTLANTDPLTKDDVITMVVLSNASWPFREDWKIWDYIAEGTGSTLDVTAIITDADAKYATMFASPETLPDIVGFSHKTGTDKFVLQGALVALDDMAEYMPNYNAWKDSLSEDEVKNVINTRKGHDGKIYAAPISGREKSQNLRAWLYRKDIFEKHNIKVPENFDELYEACKQLKELYPESYPFSARNGIYMLDVQAPSWKPYWNTQEYYDYDAGKWSYGASEDVLLDMLTYYKRMIDEKLMPSDFMTISSTSWQELVTTNRGFIMPEYQTRIDFFNSLARGKIEGFDLAAMVPPVADKENGVAMVNKYNIDPSAVVMCNTGDEQRMANAAKFLDWFYTDEAMELVSWGKEGETYEVVNGKKQYITDESGTQANTLYGISTSGTFLRMDPDAVTAFESEDIARTRDMVLEHTLPNANPNLWMAFNPDEQKIFVEYQMALRNYATEMISKFLLGQEPLSGFDAFQEALRTEFGLDEYLAVHESAYARIK